MPKVEPTRQSFFLVSITHEISIECLQQIELAPVCQDSRNNSLD